MEVEAPPRLSLSRVFIYERRVHGSFWRCRAKETSTDVLETGTMLCPSLADAVTDDWKHCLGPSNEISGSQLKSFLQWNIEDAPVEGVCHFHAAAERLW
jgi:hypothetical protein